MTKQEGKVSDVNLDYQHEVPGVQKFPTTEDVSHDEVDAGGSSEPLGGDGCDIDSASKGQGRRE